jgi:hypothetical protein
MELSRDQSQQVIRETLADLTSPVTLLYYAPDVPSAATRAEQALLEDVARASDHIHLEVLADRWDAAREEAAGIARTPAIVLRSEKDYGIRYYGAPDGYELETFLGLIRAVSDGRSGLSATSRARVGHLSRDLHLQVLVAPT